MVIFTNVGSYDSGASISSLNINSTGAKSVTTFLSGMLTKWGDGDRSNAIVLQKSCLVLFNGSSYYVPITKYNYSYSDEN